MKILVGSYELDVRKRKVKVKDGEKLLIIGKGGRSDPNSLNIKIKGDEWLHLVWSKGRIYHHLDFGDAHTRASRAYSLLVPEKQSKEVYKLVKKIVENCFDERKLKALMEKSYEVYEKSKIKDALCLISYLFGL